MNDMTADYLVVGAGAMGLAFVDALLAESDATVVIVDRYDRPGGHWTVAYPFVRLHQPSTGYGVNSLPLGKDAIDRDGPNAGLLELAGVSEILAYFEEVMRRLQRTGRVRYLPMTQYLGGGRCRSLVSGETFAVTAARSIVDATYQNVTVPAMRPPPFALGEEVVCQAPNVLASLAGQHDAFTVVGAGKTGIDTCLWLLRRGVDPDRITWIMPRDSWLIDRTLTQPGPEFAERVLPAFIGQYEAVMAATSIEDLFERLEACGRLSRIDPAVRPSMYRCATVSPGELAELRSVTRIIRKGRITAIHRDRIVLEQGEVPTTPTTFHVDCSADGLERREEVPVFADGLIRLQSVRTCQQVFSAALIGHVEARYNGLGLKNELCQPIAHPDTDLDFLRTTIADARNERRWDQEPELQEWLEGSRLNWLLKVGPALPADPDEKAQALATRRAVIDAMASRLEALLAS